jgi:hypothetical protein
MFKKTLAMLATLTLGVGLAAAAAMPSQATVVNSNEPSNWVAVQGEVCVKHDFVEPNPTTQTYADLVSLFTLSGKTVTKVIVKAGSSNGWPNAGGAVQFENEAFYTDASYQLLSMPSTTWTFDADLTDTTFSHYSGKTISHIIVCYTTPTTTTAVTGDASVAAQTCDVRSLTLVAGSITPIAMTGVVYELWNQAKTVRLIENFAANSGPLANGTYYVKVLPASGSYTVSEANTWLERIVGAYVGACDAEVKVVGDPTSFQQCVANENELNPTSTWVAYLTITTSSSQPAGSVVYRVYFDDNGTWVDQGLWSEGTYDAGPGGDIPYGTKVKVVAEAVSPHTISTPHVWEFTFTEPFRCNLPDLGAVTPVVTFAQTCSAGASYTLAIEGGVAGTVLFSLNGGPTTTTLGTFAVASPSSIVIVATPGPDSGFNGDPDAEVTFSKDFGATAACGDLTTLALTGDDVAPTLWLVGFLGLLGTAFVRSARRMISAAN